VLNNFVENLSNDWKFIIFHGNLNKEYIEEIIDEDLSEYCEKIKMVHLPYDNMSPKEYSNLLTSKTVVYDNIDTETFLIFQTDTIIIKKNKELINEFLQYDYVGAPLLAYGNIPASVGNGGLSLRKKSKMLEIMENEDIERRNEQEDYFFSTPLKVFLYKPSIIEAARFSIENYFLCNNPFGCHKPWVYGLDTFCNMHDEVKMLYNLNHYEY
jgi:RNA recognition motif-containing protein